MGITRPRPDGGVIKKTGITRPRPDGGVKSEREREQKRENNRAEILKKDRLY